MQTFVRRLVPLAAALALAPAGAAQSALDSRRPAAPDATVEIDNPSGTVKVFGWDRAEVQVSGRLGRGADGLEFEGGPRRIHIGVASHGSGHGIDSDLEIRVPHGARLVIDGFNTSVEVRDVHGSIEADSVNGSLRAIGSKGNVELETVNGSVEFEGPARRVKVSSVNGRVTVRGASGEVDAETVNGALEVTGGSFDRARLESVNGPLGFAGALAKGASLSVETVSGHVDLRLAAPVDAEFSIATFSGSIDNRLSEARATRTSRWTSEKELRFSVGSGAATVTIETLSGSVVLRSDSGK